MPPNYHTVLNREKSTYSGGADDDATGGDGMELFGDAKPMALSSGGSLAGGSAEGTIRRGVLSLDQKSHCAGGTK